MTKCLFTTLVPLTLFPKGNFSLIFPEISSDCVTVWICLYILKYLDDFLNPCKVKLHLYCVFSSCLEGAVWQVLCPASVHAQMGSRVIALILTVSGLFLRCFPNIPSVGCALLSVLCLHFATKLIDGCEGWQCFVSRNPSATFPHLIRQSRVGLLLSHAEEERTAPEGNPSQHNSEGMLDLRSSNLIVRLWNGRQVTSFTVCKWRGWMGEL